MSILSTALLFFALSLAIDLIGFRRFVYFVNIGYAFSITAMTAAAVVLFFPALTIFSALHLAGLLFWGLRLGSFLVRRERLPGYQKDRAAIQQQYGRIPRPIQAVIWVVVSFLYMLMFLPGLVHAAHTARQPGPDLTALFFQTAGFFVMAGGLLLEAIADRQKSRFKAQFPRAFCDTGLYRLVRCPNYLGEILFWVGSWMMAIPFYTTWLEWAAALLATLAIVLIMMGSTKRLETAQEQRYGSRPEYQAYIRSVPVLFPWLPLYTLKGVRVMIE
jgi:steroid 5-alpha reductase family enzyme